MKRKQKIILILATISLCLVFLRSFLSYLDDTKNLKTEINKSIQNKIQFFQEKVETFFERREIVLETEAVIVERDLNNDEQHNILERLELQFSYLKKEYGIMDIYIGYPDGELESGANQAFNSKVFKSYQRPWYKKAVENPDRVVYTDIYTDIYTGESIVTISKFLKSKDKTAVLAIDISILQLTKLLENESFGESGYAFIIDKTGKFIIHPQFGLNLKQAVINTIYSVFDGNMYQLGENLINSKDNDLLRADYKGSEKLYLSKLISDTDFVLVVGYDQRDMQTQMNIVLIYNLFISLIAVLAYVLVLMTLAWRRKKEQVSNLL